LGDGGINGRFGGGVRRCGVEDLILIVKDMNINLGVCDEEVFDGETVWVCTLAGERGGAISMLFRGFRKSVAIIIFNVL